MNLLIAPNSFKNSLSAEAAADAIRLGLEESNLSCRCTCFPVGDGGDGTADLLMMKLNGTTVKVKVRDPIGRKIDSSYGVVDNKDSGKCAVIELANASGLKLLQRNEYDPLHATSFGTGELIKHALQNGVKKILLCIGGSATVDGGVGIMEALGTIFYDSDDNKVNINPESLMKLAGIDTSALQEKINGCEIIVLCDVGNKLLGKNGAAHVFGPQKGASPETVELLDKSLGRLHDVVLKKTGIDMNELEFGGAAGGVAAGLHAVMNAKLVNGINHFLDITDFDSALNEADVVITGEGSIDSQTLQGKGPFGVAIRAKKNSIPVIGLAGQIPLHPGKEMLEIFDVLMPIGNEAGDLQMAMQNTYDNLRRSARSLGDLLALRG